MGLKNTKTVASNRSISLPNNRWEKIDTYLENSEDGRSDFFLKRVDDFFFNLENTDKPKTIKESISKWFLTGKWVDPIEKV